MAKKAYIGVNNVARKIKKGYIGVNGVARKIKKAYIGVDGVARPCWGGGWPEYYGVAPNLTGSSSRRLGYIAAAHVGNYAIFSGGNYDSNAGDGVDTVDIYDSSLVRTSTYLQGLDYGGTYRQQSCSTTSYAIFSGGMSSYNLHYFNSSLTQNYRDVQLHMTDGNGAAIGNCALFGHRAFNKIYAFNGSLTQQAALSVSSEFYDSAATTVNNIALFGGGYHWGYDDEGETAYIQNSWVASVNASLTLSYATNLSIARSGLTATTVGNYALFAGGDNDGFSEYNRVDAYDGSLTRTTATALSEIKTGLSSTSINNEYAMFIGGWNRPTWGSLYSVDIYDASLTRSVPLSTTTARHGAAVTTAGNYAIIASSVKSPVEAFVAN